MTSRVRPVMAGYYKAHEPLTHNDLQSLVPDCLPPWAAKISPNQWSWTTPAGMWHLYLRSPGETASPSEWTVRLEGSPIKATVGATRRQIEAALRFMVAVGAIESHPDDPKAKPAREQDNRP